jgi:prepilin-type N-terminal cleavage/methylation domain-containing protein
MRRRRAFTLIELLVVITIMLLLATLAMSAIFRAWLASLAMDVRVQIRSLVNACNAYTTSFDGQVPGVPAAGSYGGGSVRLSAGQGLRLSLLGCIRNGASYTGLYDGPYRDFTDPTSRKYDAYYKPRPGELLKHADIQGKDPNTQYNFTGYDANIEVFVDAGLKPPRPLLYYRRQGTAFDLGANSVYCARPGEFVSCTWSTTGCDFVFISAGLDRQYFSTDDIGSFPK